MTVAGLKCLACDYTQPWAQCSCVLRCPAPECTGERARARQVPKPPPVVDGQEALFSL